MLVRRERYRYNTGMYAVTKRIPIPPPRAAARRYPWADMAKGDSFFVPLTAASPIAVRAAAHYAGRRSSNGERYMTSQRTEGGVPGTRVWRVK
jgi:hypothetical protein